MKTKIVYCIPLLCAPGGMERVLTIKANYLVEHGYDVHIILTDGKDKEPFFKLNPNIKLHQLDINFDELNGLPFLKHFRIYTKRQRIFKKRLNECLCAIKPDITISLLRRDINLLSSMKDGSIKIGELHFDKSNCKDVPHRIPSFARKAVKHIWMSQLIKHLKKLEKFVVLTYEDQEAWTELNNTTVIYNPLSFFPDEQSTCENKVILSVGRHARQKGFERLIEAWGIISKKHPEWRLKIVGAGSTDYLQARIHDLDIKNSCILQDRTSNIKEEYLNSSIYALSSRYEGLPMVLLEAMACGVPMVSFTCPCGPKDIIKEGENGLLVEDGNITELANKLSYLIENDKLRKEMGMNARSDAKNFLPEVIMPQWIELFDSLLSKKK